MDITPQVSEDLQIINGYGDEGFTVAGRRYTGSLIVLPDKVFAWSIDAVERMTMESLAPVLDAQPPVEVLLIGSGARFQMIARELGADLRSRNIAIESMDTGAACRTYNVLLSEERRVAAALIALSPN